MFHRIFRANPATVRAVLHFLRERFDGCAESEVISKVELALAEVLNNICEHGIRHEAERLQGQPHIPLIHLCVARHVGGIACAVTDDGRPLPPLVWRLTACPRFQRRQMPWMQSFYCPKAVLAGS
ncbi:ATP-binding protein [Paracoccus kondratievae]